jgi:hypothetical protein
VRLQRARRRLGGARVLAIKLRVEPFPTFECEASAPSASRAAEPRPSSRVPSALPSSACRFGWRHPLVEGSPADGSLSRAGDECGVRRRFRVRGDDGTTTALLPDRARRGLLPFREEQEVSPPPPAWAATGGRQPLPGWQARVCGAHEPSLNHTPPAPVLHQVKVKDLIGQAGRASGRGRAGSGKTIPSGRSPPDPPSERPTPYPGSEHSWLRVSRGTH